MGVTTVPEPINFYIGFAALEECMRLYGRFVSILQWPLMDIQWIDTSRSHLLALPLTAVHCLPVIITFDISRPYLFNTIFIQNIKFCQSSPVRWVQGCLAYKSCFCWSVFCPFSQSWHPFSIPQRVFLVFYNILMMFTYLVTHFLLDM